MGACGFSSVCGLLWCNFWLLLVCWLCVGVLLPGCCLVRVWMLVVELSLCVVQIALFPGLITVGACCGVGGGSGDSGLRVLLGVWICGGVGIIPVICVLGWWLGGVILAFMLVLVLI